ncbi:hypothetical protein PHJA_002548000 [Phtheirospermum japonicum]|uniref:C2 NT-type domain-containing protein n=1 Tax=Phtheirospermum japonicum TaxID=374723 RepID=A0A830CVX7_9LAMI|nr:hypothetical protein PHJA_002548000 [Phtheirospermum japonicum]
MIRDRIFRLHRHKSSASSSPPASGQKFDFTFSNIQALQVPKGWDKLSLSLISSESVKMARKSGKVTVKAGTCKWSETFTESIWISDTDSSKETAEEYFFKFLVSGGSSRSGVLGETSLNLSAFLSSQSPVLISLPLKKCNYGTILQIEVSCLTPKKNIRDEKWKEMHARRHDNSDHDDIMENRSEMSDSTIAKNIDSCSSSNNLANVSSRPGELSNSETSFSASISRYSFDSMDDSVGRQSFSSQSDKNVSCNGIIGRQDSIESNDSASYCSYSTRGSIKSVRSFQKDEFRKLTYATKTFKENDDAKVHELEAESRMWEQNARKLAADLESLKKELSTSRSECQGLTREIEDLKFVQETENGKIQKGFEDEIRFQKEANENLSLLLKKTQESNIELVSVFQEMEETIAKQKVEIESLSANELEFINTNEQFMILECTLEDKIVKTEIEQDLKNQIIKGLLFDVSKKIGQLNAKVRELETDCNELTEENLELLFEIKELRNVDCELQKCLQRADEQREEIVELHKQLASENGSKDAISDTGFLKCVDSSTRENACECQNSSNDEPNFDGETELANHFSELREENIYLSQRVSGLEAQLRYLTDTNESSRLELQKSESQAIALRIQVTRLEEKIESQKLEHKNKLSEMQKRWTENQEECVSLSTLNVKLQATTESLVEEYNSLQKFNGELREQKIELQKQCMDLEAKSRKSRDSESKSDGEKRNELESKIKFSEIERLRLEDENSVLRKQLQKVPDMQNEVLALRVSMKEMKLQAQVLEASFESVLGDYEELKRENISMLEKVSSMQKAVLEAEDSKRKKNGLEDKILRLEGDLVEKDALCVQVNEMKNELSQMKMANSQYAMKVKTLEDELKQTELSKVSDVRRHQVPAMDYELKIQLLEKELEKALDFIYMYKLQLESARSIDSKISQTQEIAKTEHKISQLEAELLEIRERYLGISLKYAEVEAQREHLVMELKALNR